MKHWPFEVRNEGTRPKVEVEYKGEKKRFFPEEVSIALDYIMIAKWGSKVSVQFHFINKVRDKVVY
jgi:hypothetical protein